MKILTPLAAFTLGLASQVASAQESNNYYYLGVGLGPSAIGFNSDDFGTQSVASIKSTATSDTGYKLFGGYNFNENWAIEAGYANLGRFAYKWTASTDALYFNNIYTFDYKAASWFTAVKGALPVTGQLKAFGKLGVTVNKSQDTYTHDTSRNMPIGLPACLPGIGVCYPNYSTSATDFKSGSHSKTRADALIGVGIEYRALKNASIRFEYEDFGNFGNRDNTGRAKLSIWSLGVVYTF